MKKNFLTGFVMALAVAMGLTSCSDDSSSIGAGMGRISPTVMVDGDIIRASGAPGSRANQDVTVTVTDLKLKLTSDDGSFTQEWESVGDFDETQDFKVGNYTLEAYYGQENDAEGYAKPHFHGSQSIEVKYDHTTTVALSAQLKNSRVFVRYTDAFKNYMAAYSVQIHTPKGKYVTMAADEVSPVYVTPGTVNINLSFTKPNGKNATIEAARFDAKAKTEHVVTIDINGGDAGADATLKVMFDDTVDTEDVEIDLSDDLIDAPEPEITTEGWTSGQTFPLIENSPAPGQIKAAIVARGKIESVYLSTTSPTLSGIGWPEEVDLAKADEATVALLTSLGLNARGIWNRPDMMGVIDFTDVFTHLGLGPGQEESTHTFSLEVKDRYGKVSPVAEFSVVSGAGKVTIHSATAEIGFKTINAEVEYNGGNNLEDVTFQMRNLRAAWDDLVLAEAKPIDGKPGYYSARLISPFAIESTHEVRATFGSGFSKIDLVVNTPTFVLTAADEDVFAHRATITVVCAEADDEAVAKNLTFMVNGREWDNYQISGRDIILTRLAADRDYTIEASSSNHSATAQIHTEAEEHLPGCEDAEDGGHSVGFRSSLWTYDNNIKGDFQYLWIFSGWSTMNPLTMSTHGTGHSNGFDTGGCSYKATSGTIPANGRSTQSHESDGFFGNGNHADGHTTGVKDLHKNRQHDGTNAALIRTVGWGSGNSAKAGTSSNQGFNTCQNMTPGELYLGEYNGGPRYGVAFTSRPSAVSFYYHYDPVTYGNGDYGTAKVVVYSADGEPVAQDSIKLIQSSPWTDTSKNLPYTQASIPLTYEKGAKKAAKLAIIFRSTDKYRENNPALEENTTFWTTPGGSNTSGGEYVGSELYIDDVRLTY
ncbi:MAG: DUF4493 domain-containing protein [Bacteroides sp.]|nr:DUF4493 domain-containing protein [Bacteroides sp.]